jgi:hypothetical protein
MFGALGEAGPDVFFAPDALKPGTMIVVEGRALLKDGDQVAAKADPVTPKGNGEENK